MWVCDSEIPAVSLTPCLLVTGSSHLPGIEMVLTVHTTSLPLCYSVTQMPRTVTCHFIEHYWGIVILNCVPQKVDWILAGTKPCFFPFYFNYFLFLKSWCPTFRGLCLSLRCCQLRVSFTHIFLPPCPTPAVASIPLGCAGSKSLRAGVTWVTLETVSKMNRKDLGEGRGKINSNHLPISLPGWSCWKTHF